MIRDDFILSYLILFDFILNAIWLFAADLVYIRMDRLLQRCRIRNQLVRECLAEFLGMYITLIGSGSAAQVVTSEGTHGSYLTIQLGSALGAMFGIFAARGVSGAHLNIVWSMGLCILGRHPWEKLPLYALSHILGAFLGAATVYLQYYDAIQVFSGGELLVAGPSATAEIFCSYPADHLSFWGGLVDQVVATAVLLIGCLALEDRRQGPLPDGLTPVLMGALVLTIELSMGSNCGCPLNPARDLGPRLFTFIAGWGEEVFKAGGDWWWIPTVAPFVGALIGTVIYELLIEAHHRNTPQEEQSPGQELETADKEEVVVDSRNNR
uniref:Aquaporin 10b n=1 Tax=Sphaeramia orbicularis TaxID=375764 RepID=A0A673ANM0_9TELE